MEGLTKKDYLNVTDDEKSIDLSLADIDSSSSSRSRRKKEKKHKHKHRKHKKEKKSKKVKRERSRHKSKSQSRKSSEDSYKQRKANKWSTINLPNISDEPNITVVRKPIKDISEIKPNEDIPLENIEKPNFDPKETILAKETNTVK
jgi:hypothetical protein